MWQKNYQSVWEEVADGVANEIKLSMNHTSNVKESLKASIIKFFKENPIELDKLFKGHKKNHEQRVNCLVSSLFQDINLYLKNQSCLPNSTYSQYDDTRSDDLTRPFFSSAKDAEIEQLIQHTWLGLLAMTVNYRVRGESSVANVLASNGNNSLDYENTYQRLLGSKPEYDVTSIKIHIFFYKIVREEKKLSSPYLPTLLVAVGTGAATQALLYFTSTSLKISAISSILIGGICGVATYKYINSLNQYINEYNKRGENLRAALNSSQVEETPRVMTQ